MPSRKPAKADVKRLMDAINKLPSEFRVNQNRMASGLGVPHGKIRNYMRYAEFYRLGVPEFTTEDEEYEVDHNAIRERERQRHKDEVTVLKRQLEFAHRELNDAEDFRKSVFGLVTKPLDPPQWTIKPTSAHQISGTPILFTSDFQWGEVIRGEELDGINEFNQQVASRRYKSIISKTIELAFHHMVRPKYDGLIYLRGGDMISGEIHADLRETNDLQSIPAVKDLIEHELAGIEALVSKFGRVHIINVPGNHGRNTEKPHSKGYAERNFDTLSAWWLEMVCTKAYNGRVTFQTPMSGDALFNVYGWKCVLTHGDRIGSRGGEGFIGAVATITRGMKKVSDYYAAIGNPVDLQFIGHFHTALELEYGFANGSLPGFSQYARDLRMKPHPPKQWLLFAHHGRGITARWPLLLEHKPTLAQAKTEHVFQ